MAGCKVVYANEFIPAARDTYAANMAEHTFLDGRDIRDVTPEDVLEKIGMKKGELDILDGSPPCASFSTAGNREKDWGKEKKYSDGAQRSDDLFFEFARMLEGLQPRAFVAENVSGLLKGTAKGVFIEILQRLKACGYRVQVRLLDAQWLGVPQARQRTIFIGIREDLALQPEHPVPFPYRYSIRDALPWIEGAGGIRETGFAGGSITPASEPCPTIMAGGGGGMNSSQFGVISKRIATNEIVAENVGASLEGYAVGDEWDKLQQGGQSQKYFQLVRPDEGEPCPTITASGGTPSIAGVTHPREKRRFSIGELKRICAFPDDFEIKGSYSQQWERLGRSVPPVMMMQIAKAVENTLAKAK